MRSRATSVDVSLKTECSIGHDISSVLNCRSKGKAEEHIASLENVRFASPGDQGGSLLHGLRGPVLLWGVDDAC